jgi:hypothetical protein
MHITYCSNCGVRLELKAASKEKDPVCPDCAEGKKPKRSSRKGDSARIQRRKTSVLIRDASKKGKQD